LYNVMKNIEYLCEKEKEAWGTDAWKRVVVFIVADGRMAIHPRTLASLATLGVYQPNIAKDTVESRGVEHRVTAHLFENTVQRVLTPDLQLEPLNVPVQLVFCLKEQNQKKLNSHRWFFNAFCPLLNPAVCVLLDAGTAPSRTAFYQFWKTFDEEPHCAGACGQLEVDKGKGGTALWNPIVATQSAFRRRTIIALTDQQKLRVQDIKPARQADRVHGRLHICPAGRLLCVSVPGAGPEGRGPQSAGCLLPRREA
jgi:chitin synthase